LTLAKADTVLAANQAGQDTVRLAGAESAAIVPFGIDTERFSPRAWSGSRRSVTTFIVVAYLMSRKRVADVLYALAIVASRRRNVRLRIVGDGPQLEMLIALTSTLSLDGFCEFVGRVPHERVSAEYNIADVLVSASASETFGMSLLEAMACGLPVLSATNDGAAGIVQHGRTGYQFSVGDVNELAARMEEMCADTGLVRKMGAAALEHVVQTYGWNVVAATLRDLYIQ
jgi:glycosyltransferase involved in cell wall biosynthesis